MLPLLECSKHPLLECIRCHVNLPLLEGHIHFWNELDAMLMLPLWECSKHPFLECIKSSIFGVFKASIYGVFVYIPALWRDINQKWNVLSLLLQHHHVLDICSHDKPSIIGCRLYLTLAKDQSIFTLLEKGCCCVTHRGPVHKSHPRDGMILHPGGVMYASVVLPVKLVTPMSVDLYCN